MNRFYTDFNNIFALKRFKHTRIFKITAVTVISTFLHYTLWASCIAQKNTFFNNSLQVQSRFSPVNPQILHRTFIELPLKYLLNKLNNNIEHFDKCLVIPIYKDIKISLDFASKEIEGRFIILPCAVIYDKDVVYRYEVFIDKQDRSFELKKPGEIHSALEPKDIYNLFLSSSEGKEFIDYPKLKNYVGARLEDEQIWIQWLFKNYFPAV